MATLKVYSSEYGIKKIDEKVKLSIPELIVYIAFPLLIVIAIYYMISFSTEVYNLRSEESIRTIEIKKIENDNKEQEAIITELSDYERIKGVASVLGMELHKDNVKVVR